MTEYWTIQDELNEQRQLVEDFEATRSLLRGIVNATLKPVYDACPTLLDPPGDGADITVPTHLTHCLQEIGGVAEQVLSVAFYEEVMDSGLISRLR